MNFCCIGNNNFRLPEIIVNGCLALTKKRGWSF